MCKSILNLFQVFNQKNPLKSGQWNRSVKMLTVSRFWPTNIRHSINIAYSILKLNICYLQIMFCYNSWLIRRVVNGLLFIIFFCAVFIQFILFSTVCRQHAYRRSHALSRWAGLAQLQLNNLCGHLYKFQCPSVSYSAQI